MYRGSGQIFANKELIANAYENATVVPSCNIPHLPMMAPITQALMDMNSFGFIAANELTTATTPYYLFGYRYFTSLHITLG